MAQRSSGSHGKVEESRSGEDTNVMLNGELDND